MRHANYYISFIHFDVILCTVATTYNMRKQQYKNIVIYFGNRFDYLQGIHQIKLGYYKMTIIDKTNEIFTKDGWFETGDIVEWCSNGTLKILDRKKNIFKLPKGEYVRPDYIENIKNNVCMLVIYLYMLILMKHI